MQFTMAEAQDSDFDFSDEDESPLNVTFNKASNHVRKLTASLNNNQLLELYGLYKQSIEGKCDTPRPGWFDGKGRKKWDAWNALEGMPSEEAKQKYVELVQKFDPEWNELSERKSTTKETWVATSTLSHNPEPELGQDLSLIDAARENLPNRVVELIAQRPELRYERDENNLTALHWAADRNASEALTAAIDGGCDVNALDDSDQTPLHYAVSCGHLKSTKILLEAGALLLKDDEDQTPLDIATDGEIKALLQSHQENLYLKSVS